MRTILNSAIVILMTAILAGMILLGLAGCATDDPLQPLDPVFKVHSATANALMENFVLAYGGRDLELYEQLLHDDFIFTFDPVTAKRLGPAYEFFTREDELITAQNMFCGKPIVNSRGQHQGAITSIVFSAWEQAGEWAIDSEGQLRGVFDAVIQIHRDGASSFTIAGQQVFTVVLADISDSEGAVQPSYQIIGWQELSGL